MNSDQVKLEGGSETPLEFDQMCVYFLDGNVYVGLSDSRLAVKEFGPKNCSSILEASEYLTKLMSLKKS